MGYSYQDIESRLRSVESKIDFVMQNFRVTKQTPTQLTSPDGRPVVVQKQMTLLDVWREVQTGVSEIVPPSSEEEPVNVSA